MKHRSITRPEEIATVLEKAEFCTLSMVEADGSPYGLPMNFGYDEQYIYLHSARTGRKMEALKQNPRVCLSFSAFHELRYQSENVACSWSMKYKSMLLRGEVEFVEDMDEKARILNRFMQKYAERDFTYNPPALREVCIYRVKRSHWEGRAYGF